LLAVLAAPIVIFLVSTLVGRYYYGSPTQTPSPKELHRELQTRGSIAILPGFTEPSMNLHGIAYQSEPVGRPLREEDLGPKFAEPRRKTADPGTLKQVPVYAVKGYDTSFRLAASVDDSLILFEAVSNPKANEASDLLDIGGKVSSISVYEREAADLTLAKAKARDMLLGTIEDPKKVEEAVQGLMDAPLKPTPIGYYESGALSYVIVFHLNDGTAVLREYRTDTGRVTNNISGWSGDGYPPSLSGIVSPQAFREAVEEEGYILSPPDGTLSYGGREVRRDPTGSYCWGYGCLDGISLTPPRKQTLIVPSGSEMVFRWGGEPPNKVSATAYKLLAKPTPGTGERMGPDRPLTVHGTGLERTIPARLPPDKYLVGVGVTRREGEVAYLFRVSVR
jgi:hypothetical protein